MSYTPNQETLDRYADVLVNWALGGGSGIKPGQTVWVNADEDSKPLMVAVGRAIWKAGGHVVLRYLPADDSELSFDRAFYETASDEQLDFFPDKVILGMYEQADHLVHLGAERDPKALKDVPAEKLMRRQQAWMPSLQTQIARENEGTFSWTMGLYGTQAMAAEAELSLEQYWAQISKACFLDDPDPVARWRETAQRIAYFRDRLNALPIDRLHLQGEDSDIWFTLGERRQWLGGGGRNIPSFEIFTSPDWRYTNGWIRFSEPLYIHGQLVRGVELEFKDGVVVRAEAEHNGDMLRQMIATENGDKVGEFSLTDSRLSRIDHFMASTLYDENVGGPFGNTHVAIGLSLPHTYDGDPAAVTPEEWEALGYNTSAVHTDIVSTTDRIVTAVLKDGNERVIYAGGQFQLDDVTV